MNDNYKVLEKLAQQKLPKKPIDNNNPNLINKKITNDAIERIIRTTNESKSMYPKDPNQRFDFWKKQISVDQVPDEAREVYWEQYEKLHPQGKTGARKDLVGITLGEMDLIHGLSKKEFFLRDRINRSPHWAKEALEPILGELSTVVASSNYSKSQQVYLQNLDDRMQSFMLQAKLDPDLPTETHVGDVLKLEQMNLMDVSVVQFGRVGINNKEGKFIPAAGVQSRDEFSESNTDYSTPSLEEQTVIRNIAPGIIKRSVEANLINTRQHITKQEQLSEAVAEQYLRRGDYEMDQWSTAFAIISGSNITDKLVKGLQGEIQSKRIKTDRDLVQSLYKAVNLYQDHLKDMK